MGEPRMMKDGSKACVGEYAPYRALYQTDMVATTTTTGTAAAATPAKCEQAGGVSGWRS